MAERSPGGPLGRLAAQVSLLAYLTGWRIVRMLPERAAYPLFDLFADVAWRRNGRGVQRLRANLRRVLTWRDGRTPGERELDVVTRAGMRSYLRYWCDAFRLPGWSRERTVSTHRTIGLERAQAHLDAGRGVVMALAHQGNWDHAGAWSSLELARVTTVAERLEPERLAREFLAYRERLGMEILTLDVGPSGGGEVFPTLLRRLRAGGFVPLLADRDLTSRGVEVLLCGHRARMAAGPATLALMSGAALLPVSIWYERLDGAGGRPRWGVVTQFHPEVHPPETGTRARKIAQMCQELADALGRGIAEHPQDWHMLQRVFVADLDPARAAGGQACQESPAVEGA